MSVDFFFTDVFISSTHVNVSFRRFGVFYPHCFSSFTYIFNSFTHVDFFFA